MLKISRKSAPCENNAKRVRATNLLLPDRVKAPSFQTDVLDRNSLRTSPCIVPNLTALDNIIYCIYHHDATATPFHKRR